MTEQPCKNCAQPTHQLHIRKYHGYCLGCANAGVIELRDEIDDLRATAQKLADALRFATANVVSRNAGAQSEFAYLWSKDWATFEGMAAAAMAAYERTVKP